MANLPGFKKTLVIPCAHMGVIRKIATFYDDPEQVVKTAEAISANRTGKTDGYYGDSSEKSEGITKFGKDLLTTMPYAVKQKYDWLKTGNEGGSWYGGSSSSDESGCPQYEMNAGFWSFIAYSTGDSLSSISQTYPLAIFISNHVTSASSALAGNIEKLISDEKNRNGIRMPDEEARDYIAGRYTACLQKNSTENLAWRDLVEDCTDALKDAKRSEFRKKLKECVQTEADKKDCSSDLPTFDKENVAQDCMKETWLSKSDVKRLFDQRYDSCMGALRKVDDPTTFAVSVGMYDVLNGTDAPTTPSNTTDVCQSALAMVTKPDAKKVDDDGTYARSRSYGSSSDDEEKVLAPKDKLNKIFQAYGVIPGKFEWEDWRKYHDFSVPASAWDKTLLVVGGRVSKWLVPSVIALRFILKGGLTSVAIKSIEFFMDPKSFVARWKEKFHLKHPPKPPKAPKNKDDGTPKKPGSDATTSGDGPAGSAPDKPVEVGEGSKRSMLPEKLLAPVPFAADWNGAREFARAKEPLMQPWQYKSIAGASAVILTGGLALYFEVPALVLAPAAAAL